jgi:hypothetical protein
MSTYFDPTFAPEPALPEYRTVTINGQEIEIEIYPESHGYTARYNDQVRFARSPQAAFESLIEQLEAEISTEE